MGRHASGRDQELQLLCSGLQLGGGSQGWLCLPQAGVPPPGALPACPCPSRASTSTAWWWRSGTSCWSKSMCEWAWVACGARGVHQVLPSCGGREEAEAGRGGTSSGGRAVFPQPVPGPERNPEVRAAPGSLGAAAGWWPAEHRWGWPNGAFRGLGEEVAQQDRGACGRWPWAPLGEGPAIHPQPCLSRLGGRRQGSLHPSSSCGLLSACPEAASSGLLVQQEGFLEGPCRAPGLPPKAQEATPGAWPAGLCLGVGRRRCLPGGGGSPDACAAVVPASLLRPHSPTVGASGRLPRVHLFPGGALRPELRRRTGGERGPRVGS